MEDAIKNGPCRLENCPKRQLSNPSKWTLQGHSKAGERTGFWIEQLRICLDAGLSTYRSPRAIFISHSHTDHSVHVADIFARKDKPLKGQEDLKGRPVYIPETAKLPIIQLQHAMTSLSFGHLVPDIGVEFYHQKMVSLVPCQPFQTFEVPGVPGIQVEVLPAYHRADSIGYGFSSVRTVLKDEYKSMAETNLPQFLELKKKLGDKINEIRIVPELMFYSDSTIDNLTKHSEWQKYPVVIVECTGFSEIHTIEKVIKMSHTHWDQLFPIMKTHPEIEWIIIHTTMGMSNKMLLKYQHIMDTEGIRGYIWLAGQLENVKL